MLRRGRRREPVFHHQAGYAGELSDVGRYDGEIQCERVRCDEEIVRSDARSLLRQVLANGCVVSVGGRFQREYLQCGQNQVDAVGQALRT